MIGAKISSIARPASLAPARSRAVTVNSSSRARCFDQTSKRLRLSGGTPSIQVMTRRGSGCATSRTRSKLAGVATRSSSSVVMVRIRGSSASTARDVNASLTNRRSRVCSGGSTSSRL